MSADKPAPIMWGNVPIPYTAYWSDELPIKAWQVRRVRAFGNLPFLFEEVSTPGAGKPKLSLFHTGRAVEVMSRHLCQICRGQLFLSRFYCIGFGRTINGLPHITDGLPMCKACTRLSLIHCPTLVERAAAGAMTLYSVLAYNLAPAILGEAADGEPGVNEALRAWRGARPVYGTPKIALTRFSAVPVDQFMRETETPS